MGTDGSGKAVRGESGTYGASGGAGGEGRIEIGVGK